MKSAARWIYALASLFLLLPATASAQEEWQFRIIPYLWFAGVEGDVATIPGAPEAPLDISSSQALEDTDASLMGVFEVKKGRHGGFVDLVYTDLRSDTELVGDPINLTLKSTSKNTLLSVAYQYELYKDERAVADVFAGARYWSIDTKLEFGGGLGLLAGRFVRHDETWVDPLIGIKGSSALGDSNFFAAGVLGLGGFGVGSDRFYDASVHLGYQWTKLIGTTIGYRMYDVKYDKDSFLYNVRQEGWMVGVSFDF